MLKQFNLQEKVFADPLVVQNDQGEWQLTTSGEGWFAVEAQEEINAISASITGGGEVWLEKGKLCTSGKCPTDNHIWNAQTKRFELNPDAEKERVAQRKAELLAIIATKADQLKSLVFAGYSTAEVESFYRQEKEALALKDDPTYPALMLNSIAQSRGVPLEILAQKVLEKADRAAPIIGGILGKKQQLEDRIQAVENLEDFANLEAEIEQWQL